MKKSTQFLTLLTITSFFTLISVEILNEDKLLINSLIKQFTDEQINQILYYKNKWNWVKYVITPFFLILKVLIISAILDIGCFFFGKEIKYRKLFNIVVKAEFIFLLVIVFKTSWFYFFKTDYNLENLQYFYPLSAINIVGYQSLDIWFIYPLQILNLFEVAYWFILAYLIGKEINETTEKGFSIVASSYGVSLLIWVAGIMFLTLNMS
jgi:hypothetical protein